MILRAFSEQNDSIFLFASSTKPNIFTSPGGGYLFCISDCSHGESHRDRSARGQGLCSGFSAAQHSSEQILSPKSCIFDKSGHFPGHGGPHRWSSHLTMSPLFPSHLQHPGPTGATRERAGTGSAWLMPVPGLHKAAERTQKENKGTEKHGHTQ